jgi:hypothetical protein
MMLRSIILTAPTLANHNLCTPFLSPQACPRCCLRLSGVRAEVYGLPSPPRAAFVEAVAQATSKPDPVTLSGAGAAAPGADHNSNPAGCQRAQDTASVQPVTTSAGTDPCSANGGQKPPGASCTDVGAAGRQGTPADSDAAAPAAATADTAAAETTAAAAADDLGTVASGPPAAKPQNTSPPDSASAGGSATDGVCTLCLGILQGVDPDAALPSAGSRRVALPETNANGGAWRIQERSSAAAIAENIRRAHSKWLSS